MGATIVNFFKLVWMQLKINCKNINTLITLLVIPIVTTVAIIHFLPSGSEDEVQATPLLFINKDQGELATAMLETLDTADIKLEDNLDDALAKLENNEAIALYVIEEDFSALLQSAEIPFIQSYQIETDKVVLFENEMQNFMQQQAKVALLQEQGIDYGEIENVRFIDFEMDRFEEREVLVDVLPIMMAIYYLFLTSNTIAVNLFNLKANNVLKRIMTTNNSNLTILSSFCASYFLLQTAATFFVFMIFQFVFGYHVGNLFILFITISLMSMISISFSVLIARVCKKEMMVSQVTSFMGLVLFFAGMVVLFKEVFPVPSFIIILAQLSPFYWANEVLIFENVFPGIPILLLIMFVVLTAGSLKLERFIQE